MGCSFHRFYGPGFGPAMLPAASVRIAMATAAVASIATVGYAPIPGRRNPAAEAEARRLALHGPKRGRW